MNIVPLHEHKQKKNLFDERNHQTGIICNYFCWNILATLVTGVDFKSGVSIFTDES